MYTTLLLLAVTAQNGSAWNVRPVVPVKREQTVRGWALRTVQPAKPSASKPLPIQPQIVQTVYTQRVMYGPPPWPYNWTGDWNPSPNYARFHLRTMHRDYLPQGVSLNYLDMEALNRIHSWLHNGRTNLGYWERSLSSAGIQTYTWVWTL